MTRTPAARGVANLHAVFERYYRELLNFVARSLGNRDRAADVVQEAFVRVLALQGQHAGPIAVQQPRALLYRTAKNIVIDQHRRDRVRDHEALDLADATEVAMPASAQPEERLAARQSAQRLLAAIDRLPPRCKEAFVLYKLDGMPQAEIAERMGITRNAVEKHVIAGMVACRRAMGDATA